MESFNCTINDDDVCEIEENMECDTRIFMLKNEPNAPTITKSMSYEEFVLYFLRTSDVICMSNKNSCSNSSRRNSAVDEEEIITDTTQIPTNNGVNFEKNITKTCTKDPLSNEVLEKDKVLVDDNFNDLMSVEVNGFENTWTQDEEGTFNDDNNIMSNVVIALEKYSENNETIVQENEITIFHCEHESCCNSANNIVKIKVESQEDNATETANCHKCGEPLGSSTMDPQNKFENKNYQIEKQLSLLRKTKKKLRVLEDELSMKNKTSKQLNRRIQQEIHCLKKAQKQSEKSVNEILVTRVKLHALILTTVFCHIHANEIENVSYEMELKIGRENFDAEEKLNEFGIQEEVQISNLRILETKKKALWNLEKALVKYKVLLQKVQQITRHKS